MIISGIEEEYRRVKAYWCRYARRRGCFLAGAETGAANPPRVASGRRLFDYSNLLQFCRNLVGDL